MEDMGWTYENILGYVAMGELLPTPNPKFDALLERRYSKKVSPWRGNEWASHYRTKAELLWMPAVLICGVRAAVSCAGDARFQRSDPGAVTMGYYEFNIRMACAI
jgi:hypothetical protein